jgi:hypothetical protein
MPQVKHSINLYLPRFRPAQLSPAIQRLITLCLTVLSGLLVLSVGLLLSNEYFANQLELAKQEQTRLSKELNIVVSQLPNAVVDKNLQNQIAREEKRLARQRRVITFLRQDSISESSSFTSLVEQLAQQNLNGIWLKRFEVINQGQDIQLYGYSKGPEKVSSYLSVLGTQPAYKGRAFKQINIVRGSNSLNEFFLSTQQEKNSEMLIQQTIEGAGL